MLYNLTDIFSSEGKEETLTTAYESEQVIIHSEKYPICECSPLTLTLTNKAKGEVLLQGEVSLSDSLDAEDEGNSLSLMDVVKVDDTMLEDLELRDACAKVRRCLSCLTPRENHIIRLRYGLDDQQPLTQREIAVLCGISRSYVSRIEKKALEKLKAAYEKA